MSDNPNDAILKTIAMTCLGIIAAPFVLVILVVIEGSQWIIGKIMGR